MDDYGNYNRIGMMAFAVLSVVGLILPYLLILLSGIGLIIIVVLIILFAFSYIKIRNADGANIYSYLFALTAPSSVPVLIGLLIPVIPSIVFSLIGVFAAYFVLSGKNMLG